METQIKLAKDYGYKPLPPEKSAFYREFYSKSIPSFLKLEGEKCPLYNKEGTKICHKYDRIVIGDYGAFVEFSNEEACFINYIIEMGEEYRLDGIYNVKYHWYTTIDNTHIKLYYQVGTVSYADYKVGKWYVSIHEVIKGKEND